MYAINVKSFSSLRTFVLGVVSGFIFMTLLHIPSVVFNGFVTSDIRYKRGSSENHGGEINPTSFNQDLFHLMPEYKDHEVAMYLAKNVRVLCWVATMPNNHIMKAARIRDTWGNRCNILLFMSSMSDNALPAVVLDVKEGREYLFDKTKAAMVYVYKNYMDSLDWVLKTDDDTFVVVENLRYLLSNYDPSQALYLGCRFKTFTKQGFMSGGAGYVLSRKALKLFVEEAIPNKEKCLQLGSGEGEDVQMGRCLENVNVTAIDTRDELRRARFFPYHPQFHLFPDHISQVYDWYWKYQYYHNDEGLECCSDTAVSFHYISPQQLYVLDYLVHSLKVYGTSIYYRYEEPTIVKV